MLAFALNVRTMNLPQAPFNIGDIVAMKSNPLFEGLNEMIVSGDSDTLSPLMIVIEILPAVSKQGDENILNCNCIWYSHKSWLFEEAWLSSALLKMIRKRKEISHDGNDWPIGTLVSLSTLDIELAKRRSYLRFEGNDPDDRKGQSTIQHLHSFLSPVMSIVDVYKNEPQKTKKKNSKPNPNKVFSSLIAKCKWFNADTEKMSEAMLPIDSLSAIEQPNIDKLSLINEAIKNKTIYIINGFENTVTCARFLDIVYLCGTYLIRAFDYIENKVYEIELSRLIEVLGNHILAEAPNFNIVANEVRSSYDILQGERMACIEQARLGSHFLRLKYLTSQSKVSWRTISNYQIVSLNEGEEGKVDYLTGYCHSRKEIRTFRIDRILKMQQLNLCFESDLDN